MNVLVIRFSSIGDVALTLPAIKTALEQNSHLRITFLTKDFFEPLFFGTERLRFIGVNLNNYKGLNGLLRLSNRLRKDNKNDPFDAVLDLHDSLRSKVIRTYFRLFGASTFVIDKGRREKSALTDRNHKKLVPLKHHAERYADVFRSAGLFVALSNSRTKYIEPSHTSIELAKALLAPFAGNQWIGIAPFAGSKLKEWPLEKFQTLIPQIFSSAPNTCIFLFGGKADIEKLENLKQLNPNRLIIVAGVSGGLSTELAIIQQLDLMVAMDSGNMHLATFLGTKVKAI
ncbi:MAG: glycosyltransferase family 9 protein, partial [Cytophagales bacterium]|nr:glycosyltransferase family 9 protein [Cytophagales bacterium]